MTFRRTATTLKTPQSQRFYNLEGRKSLTILPALLGSAAGTCGPEVQAKQRFAARFSFGWFVSFEGNAMARVCRICGKCPGTGNKLKQRGKPKYLGGNGRKTTGKTKRKFLVNLQYVQIATPDGNRRSRVCTQCIRSGRIQKAVRRQPFQVPGISGPAATAAPATAN